MTHEPECPFYGNPYAPEDSAYPCGGCIHVRAAHQRGREDAAIAVTQKAVVLGIANYAANYALFAAARGDGAK